KKKKKKKTTFFYFFFFKPKLLSFIKKKKKKKKDVLIAPLWIITSGVVILSLRVLYGSDNLRFYAVLTVFTMLPWMGVWYIRYLLRWIEMDDFFRIRAELMEGATMTVVITALYFVTALLNLALLQNPEKVRQRIHALIFFLFCTIWGQLLLFISTTLVVRRNDQYLQQRVTKKEHKTTHRLSHAIGGLDTTSKASPFPDSPVAGPVKHKQFEYNQNSTVAVTGNIHHFVDKKHFQFVMSSTMPEYIRHNRGLEIFANHLNHLQLGCFDCFFNVQIRIVQYAIALREFAMENLLFLVQLHQWKDHLQKKHMFCKYIKYINI
ncbi:hypothetical protein RFI_28903, partial [Reticulomyxa filosa]